MNEGEGTVVVESSPSKDVYDDSRWPPRFLYVNTHAWCSSSWIRATICIARVYGSGCKLNREGSGGGGRGGGEGEKDKRNVGRLHAADKRSHLT